MGNMWVLGGSVEEVTNRIRKQILDHYHLKELPDELAKEGRDVDFQQALLWEPEWMCMRSMAMATLRAQTADLVVVDLAGLQARCVLDSLLESQGEESVLGARLLARTYQTETLLKQVLWEWTEKQPELGTKAQSAKSYVLEELEFLAQRKDLLIGRGFALNQALPSAKALKDQINRVGPTGLVFVAHCAGEPFIEAAHDLREKYGSSKFSLDELCAAGATTCPEAFATYAWVSNVLTEFYNASEFWLKNGRTLSTFTCPTGGFVH